MGVKLKYRENLDGTETPYLVINKDKKRKYKFLPHLKLPAGKSPADRQLRKENKVEAEKILTQKRQQVEAADYGLVTEAAKKVFVLEWMKGYAKKYKEKDVRMINAVVAKFAEYLAEESESKLLMKEFDNSIVEGFRDKLQKENTGEGGKSYFNRFRKILRQAYKENLLIKNPCEGVDPPTGDAKIKDTLTSEELQLIAETPTEAPEVKRAFLFCSITGLRFGDCKELTWESIKKVKITEEKIDEETNKPVKVEIEADLMVVDQLKTGKMANITLNRSAMELLGKRGGDKRHIFNLGSANGCNKSLKALVKRAEIDKKITWHCARHSFGTNLIFNKVDIHTASKLLGHTSLTHTQRYVHESLKLNKDAVNSLPGIKLGSRIVENYEEGMMVIIKKAPVNKVPRKKK